MSKKILIVTDNVPEQINGVVVTFQNIEKHAVLDGYTIVYLDPREFLSFSCPGYPEVKLACPWNIGEKIKEISPNYIHIATEGPVGLAARLYLDNRRIRYNTSYHTKFPEFLKQIYGIPERFTWGYMRWFHKHSGKVLVNTESMLSLLVRKGFTGRMITWTRGVDRGEFTPTIKHVRNEKPIVLYVGRVSKEKNLDELCVLQDKYNIEIVGDGPYRNTLEKKYSKVKFLGYQKGFELANSYARADVFAFPSKSDTFGIVMIEAMSVGTPVAAHPVDGPIDIVEKTTGCLSDNLDEAIQVCLNLDRKQIEKLSKKWTWEECWNIFRDNLIPIK